MPYAEESFRGMSKLNLRILKFLILLILSGGRPSALLAEITQVQESEDTIQILAPMHFLDSLKPVDQNKFRILDIASLDSIGENSADRYDHLTESDFRLVAEELGVEVAAIKAVVEIEAGKAMKGFWAPGIPVINFDQTMYQKYRNKALSKEGAKGEKVPGGLSGYALKEWTQLINARKVNAQGANMGTFWGMFQIGGFNYKLCGCATVNEFVKRMAYSELEQLQLFAVFITNTGMVSSIRNKDWRTFARKYNGPKYAQRGYHTKLAKAYAKYSK